jgi:pimeloyl-ACP methyl ester carboxylesterase
MGYALTDGPQAVAWYDFYMARQPKKAKILYETLAAGKAYMVPAELPHYYEIRGTGPRLLSISGTGADLRRSPNIFAMPIARHFEILAYDQRGLGQTSRPNIPYSMADYAGDTDGLLEVVGWDRCMVLGISFGLVLAGLALAGFIPQISYVLPVTMDKVAQLVVLQMPLPAMFISEIISAAVLSIVFIAVALWRFQRKEF